MPHPNEGQPTTPDHQTITQAEFASYTAQIDHIPRIFGVDVSMKPGDHWKTELHPDGSVEMVYGVDWFVEHGYSLDEALCLTGHEVASHVRRALYYPELTKESKKFAGQGKAQALFNNIFEDIAGDKFEYARLPRMGVVGTQMYRDKLFPDDPPPLDDPLGQKKRYADLPRHVQFVYAIIRQEMIPGSFTAVSPEVNEAIGRLRSYQDTGQDVISYSTNVSKPDGSPMPPEEQFALWTTVIYPEFEALLEQDKQDPNFQNQPGQDGQPGQGDGQPGEQGQDSQGQQPGEGQPQQGESGESSHGHHDSSGQFGDVYKDYWDNKHPELLSHEDYEKLAEAAEEAKKRSNPNAQKRRVQERFKEQTGHSLHEQQSYNQELIKRQEAVDAIRDLFFKRILSPQLTVKRRLGTTLQSEGAILDPNNLAETVADIAGGADEPKAFLDYEHRRTTAETVGNTDYYLVIDRSQSMGEGTKAKNAASCTLVFLEGLDGIEKDIEEAEAEFGVSLDISIRSAVYGFGNEAQLLKPLSPRLDTKERLGSYNAACQPTNEGTADYLALQAINNEPREDEDRRRIIVVLSDGESNDVDIATEAVGDLRSSPNTLVYGISIGSDAAVELYSPNARRVDNPDDLPAALAALLEETLQ